jgi:hypothetical protein
LLYYLDTCHYVPAFAVKNGFIVLADQIRVHLVLSTEQHL